ncbi:MAG: hypothetical protein ACOZDD_09610 [Bacteroidota bacterium]
MKRINLLLIWAVVMVFAVTNLNAAETGRETTKYEITPLDDLNFGTRFEKAWAINYGSQKVPVTVVKHKTNEGFDYAVHSEFFEVCYSLNATGFGAKKLKRSMCTVSPEINKLVVNTSELDRQRILTPNKVDDEMALGLIASYLPSLLNPAYAHLLN